MNTGGLSRPNAAGPRAGSRGSLALAGLTVLLSLTLLVAPTPPSQASVPASPTPSPAPAEPPADGEDPQTEAERVGFGVVPATADAVDLRAFFSYGLTPGAVAYDHVAIVNYSTGDLVLDVYATDALTAAEGGFALRAATEAPVDLGAWVSLGAGERTVTVPGRSAGGAPGHIILPVTITVPVDATPGDHAAGIVASLATLGQNPEGQNIQLEQRVAARVYVRVDGPLEPALTISGLEASFVEGALPWQQGTVEVTYTVANTGNLRMGFEPSVTVAGPGGLASRTVAADPVAELLPGNSQAFTATVSGVWPAGFLDVTSSVTPVAAVAAEPPGLGVVTDTIRILALTWEALVAVVLLVALLAFLGYRATRRRRRAPAGQPAPVESKGSDVPVGSSAP